MSVALTWFCLLCHVIGTEISNHPLNQSHSKIKPIAIWSLPFSRALGGLFVFTLRSYWLLMILSFHPIGCCDCSIVIVIAFVNNTHCIFAALRIRLS